MVNLMSSQSGPPVFRRIAQYKSPQALRDRLYDLRAAIEMEEAARATLMQANSNAALTWDPTANAEEEAPPVRRMRPSTAPSRRPDPEGLRLQRLQEAMRGDGLM